MARIGHLIAAIPLFFASHGTWAKNAPDPLCRAAQSVAREGDLVFLELSSPIFQRVARVTGSWASHVGVVLRDDQSQELIVAESTIPFVKRTNFCQFIHHAKNDHFLIKHFKTQLTRSEIMRMQERADELMGTLYHTGFKFHSKRQFCSKFAWELYHAALGIDIGYFQKFGDLLANEKGSPYEKQDMAFWRAWFFGFIPWDRITISPKSEMDDDRFEDVFYNEGSPSS